MIFVVSQNSELLYAQEKSEGTATQCGMRSWTSESVDA